GSRPISGPSEPFGEPPVHKPEPRRNWWVEPAATSDPERGRRLPTAQCRERQPAVSNIESNRIRPRLGQAREGGRKFIAHGLLALLALPGSAAQAAVVISSEGVEAPY